MSAPVPNPHLYPRIIDRAAIRARAMPNVRAILELWEFFSVPPTLPHLSQMAGPVLTPWQDNLCLVEVTYAPEFQLTYRQMGKGMIFLRGGISPVGKTVQESFYGLSRDAVVGNYLMAIAERTPLLDLDVTPGNADEDTQTLYLPLRGDDTGVAAVIVYVAITPRQARSR